MDPPKCTHEYFVKHHALRLEGFGYKVTSSLFLIAIREFVVLFNKFRDQPQPANYGSKRRRNFARSRWLLLLLSRALLGSCLLSVHSRPRLVTARWWETNRLYTKETLSQQANRISVVLVELRQKKSLPLTQFSTLHPDRCWESIS